jgi:3-methyladenine DNA glycosylase AlkC
LYTLQPLKAEEITLRIADDAHWEVREDVDNVMLEIVKFDFDEAYALLKKWTKHPSENVRRAVVMTAKKAGRERRLEWACPLLDLLEYLLNDRSVYVRKNLGPFAIGDGFLRYHPAITLQYLETWSKMEDGQVRWNVAMAFSSAEAAKHIEAALPILERLACDERRFVWRAVTSAMRNLGRRVPDRVLPVLERWLKDELRVRPAQTVFKYL